MSVIGYIIIPFFLVFVIGGLALGSRPDLARQHLDGCSPVREGEEGQASTSPGRGHHSLHLF